MRLLLDTHVLMWAMASSRRLPGAWRELVEDPAHEKLFSAASIWEIAIKFSLGRADFAVDPALLLATARMDFLEVPITSDVAVRVAGLPRHHRDPFDRLLVAQAMDSDALLLTVDAQLAAYAPHVLMLA